MASGSTGGCSCGGLTPAMSEQSSRAGQGVGFVENWTRGSSRVRRKVEAVVGIGNRAESANSSGFGHCRVRPDLLRREQEEDCAGPARQ